MPASALPVRVRNSRTRMMVSRFAAGAFLAVLLVCAGDARVVADPVPLTAGEQAQIQIAIDKGVRFLQQSQNGSGSWGTGTNVGAGGGWAIGYTALAGITLIECGVRTDDKQVRAAANVVRQGAIRCESPYEIALAILFLDRMADTKDRGLIQTLAIRLIVGQTPSGGWAYKVPSPAAGETAQVIDALRKMNPIQGNNSLLNFRERPSQFGLCIKMSDDIRPKSGPTSVAESADPEKAKAAALAKLTPGVRRLPVFQDLEQINMVDPEGKRSDPVYGTTDNSNTHFAILGVWTARRYDIPTERTFSLLVRRFRTSQNENGLWAYDYVNGGGAGGSPAMTSVALLALAIGHALNLEPEVAAKPEQDPQILKALKALSNFVGEPAGTMQGRPPVEQVRGLYFLWAMERIAVLYDLRTLGDKDWYKWGAEILVSNQTADGSWAKGGFHGDTPIVSTCLALLFLKRANLLPDLSRKFAVDSTALVAKPKAEKLPPPPVVVVPTIPTLPEPTTTEEPTEPEQKTAAPAPQSAPQSEPAATTTTAAKEDRPIWPWIVGLLVLLIAGGVGIYFAVKARKNDEDDDEDDEEKPRKKKRKHKV